MLKNLIKRLSYIIFEISQGLGMFVIPIHFYVGIASTRNLRATISRWNRPIDVSPIWMALDDNIVVLERWISPYESEFRGNKVYKKAAGSGSGYGYIEAQALHAFIRTTAPKRIIEIGSGVSTMCMLAATALNESEGRGGASITCIEPHPRNRLKNLPIRLIEDVVENVELTLFDDLEPGDLLFIDSSHAFRPCGDVQRIYLEILPRLKAGVFVHIHDIYIPYAFPRDVISTYIQSMESALLMAILAHSVRYEVVLCLSYLHYRAPEALKKGFPEYVPQPNNGGLGVDDNGVPLCDGTKHFPSAIYLVVHPNNERK